MKANARKLYQRVTNSTLAVMLAVSTLTASMPFIFSDSASAVGPSEVVYDALPSVDPPTNYQSYGLQAHSIEEFGDRIKLGGSHRVLDTVTVTMTDWAKYSSYTSNPIYNGNDTHWAHPITVNVYDKDLNVLASKEQTVSIPWRPESNPDCGDTSNGKGWKVGDTCYNLSGYAFNATIDLSSLNVALPEDIVLGLEYNTNTRGDAPIGVSGPYDSLNITFPANQAVSVGTDYDTNWAYADASWNLGFGTFAAFETLPTAGTVAFQVTATKIAAPNLIAPVNNAYVNGVSLTNSWSSVLGAVNYEYQSYNDAAKTSIRFTQTLAGTSKTATNVADTSFWWNVRSIDAYGNMSDWSELRKVTVDHTKPVAPINGLPATTNTNDFYFSWDPVTDGGSPIVEYQFQSSGSNATSGGSLIGAWQNWVSGTGDQVFLPSATIHSFGAPDGTYYWQARAIDASGNVSPWSSVWTTTIDSVAPAAPELKVRVGSTDLTSGQSTTEYAIEAHWNTPSGDPVKYNYRYWNNIPGNQYNDVSTAYYNNNLSGNSLAGVFNQGEGTHFMQVQGVDAFGNASEWSNTFALTYDITAPTFDYNGSTQVGNVITPDLAILGDYDSFTWTADPANNAGVTFDGTEVAPDFTVTSNGTYNFTITAVDAAGNDNSFIFTFTYTAPVVVAAVQPTPPATTPPAFTGIIGAAADQDVLGATTDDTDADNTGTADVEGATDTKFAAADTDANGNILGLAWYWWILILAGLAGLAWGIMAAFRRRNSEQ